MFRTTTCSGKDVGEIGRLVGAGGVIVFPTDTVYGMGCDPYNRAAVERVYRIKQREAGKPLPVLAHSVSDLEGIAEFGPGAKRVASKFWPGRVTMLLKLRDGRLGESLGIGERIAVRVPGGGCARSILGECGLLVGTSANRSGEGPYVDPGRCLLDIGRDCDLFVDGGVIAGGGGESTIVDLSSGDGTAAAAAAVEIVREGAVGRQEILDAL